MTDKWWDISDDDLDNVFKDAAEGNLPPFDNAVWKNMENKLDQSSTNRLPLAYKTWWLSGGLLLLLLGGITYFNLSDNQSIKKKNITPSTQNTIKSAESRDVEKSKFQEKIATTAKNQEVVKSKDFTQKIAEKSRNQEQTESVSYGNTNKTVDSRGVEKLGNREKAQKSAQNDANKVTLANKAIERKTSGSQNSTALKVDKQVAENQKKEEKIKQEVLQIKSEVANQPLMEKNGTKTNKNVVENTISQSNRSKSKPQKVDKTIFGVSTLPEPINPLTDKNIKTVQENTLSVSPELINAPEEKIEVNSLVIKKLTMNKINIQPEIPDFSKPEPLFVLSNQPLPRVRINRPRSGIQLSISPDLNSVETFNPSAFGGSLGLMYEYEFLHRLRVQIGALYTIKNYYAGIETYHAWQKATTYPNPVVAVDAKCEILDIPINVRYDAWRAAKYDVFVSAGLSSYLMLHERYVYVNATPTSWPYIVDQNRSGDYYFGAFNFSLGYERQIGQNFSFQVEPYAKFAMKQVGLGKVNLYSTGVLFSIKARFGKSVNSK